MKFNLYRLAGLLLCLVVSLLSVSEMDAADLVVRNFRSLPTDQTAINRETMKKDQNGNTAALIKIYTRLKPNDIYFDNGVMGVVARENRPGQIWLYLPARSQKIRISTTGNSPITHHFEEMIQSGRTYSMELTTEGKEVTLVANVHDAPIIIDGDSVGHSPLNTYLSYGVHRVIAQLGSMSYEDNIYVTKDGPSRFDLKMEDENHKYGEVKVTVPDKAEIWFEGKRVGLGEWQTRLKEGNYIVELRKKNCEPTMENFNIEPGKATTVAAKAPIPLKGYLSVEVRPALGTRIFHADTLVAENRLNRQLKVGNYTYTFRRKGYLPQTRTFRVNGNLETIDTVRLERRQYIKSNSLYGALGFTYGNMPGVTLNVGGTCQNFALEIGYTVGITKSDKVYWFQTGTNLFEGATDYAVDEMGIRAGYQFSFIRRFGITPQAGYLGQRVRGGSHGNGAMCHNVTVGARCIFNPLEILGIFVTPQYAIPVSVNPLYSDITSHAGIGKGGFFVTAGIAFTF